VSGLYGLWPGDEITPRGTPAEAAAASVTLDRRGTGGCGWSYGWKVGLRARLGEAEKAHEQVARYLSDNVLTNLFSRCGRALQVDGSFGTTAGIAEMLLQSHTDTLDVLPALPAEWPNGRITGLRARGGLTVDLTWTNGRVQELVLHPFLTGSVIVRGMPSGRVEPAAEAMSLGESGELRLDLRGGTAYRIVAP
jgi:alpha-L-fucosidase 2